MKAAKRKWVLTSAALLIGLLCFLAFRPAAVEVQIAPVSRGLLQETLTQEGKSRMHDHFVVASPVAGRLRRIELHAGDPVKAQQIIAEIEPVPLEPQQRAELEARLNASEQVQKEADARVKRTEAQLLQANADLDRAIGLAAAKVISRETLEKAQTTAKTAAKELEAETFSSRAAAFQVEEARAALLATTAGVPRGAKIVSLRSPVAGHVLRLLEQSERVVAAGTPIAEIGYTPRLEVVADFLTTDAVRIAPGMRAWIEHWGGPQPLPAQVRVVEPGAFTKVSALGVEEQRVNVVLDIIGSPAGLGDAFRVDVRVITWEDPAALKVPISALFRRGDDWNVFTVARNRAVRRIVKIGHQSELEAEVLGGLTEGEPVIVHPGNDLTGGMRVTQRTSTSN